MGDSTKIEWADKTFNPWLGCTKVSPACDHCYAESWAKRTGNAELWNGTRRRTTAANWRKPLKWNADAAARGVRYRVFCASLADVFDNDVDPAWREDLFSLIARTPCLVWLLLTKRIGNADKMVPYAWREFGWPDNVWLGATVVTQAEYDRDIKKLINITASVRFLSMEPLLEPVDVTEWATELDWVIVGGESGHGARVMQPQWARSLRDQCKRNDVAFFMKQMTRKEPIPADLLVRQFPTIA